MQREKICDTAWSITERLVKTDTAPPRIDYPEVQERSSRFEQYKGNVFVKGSLNASVMNEGDSNPQRVIRQKHFQYVPMGHTKRAQSEVLARLMEAQ